MTNKLRDKYLVILDLLRCFQRRHRFVGQAQSSGLSIATASLLRELVGPKAVFASALVETLRLDKSTLSREIRALKDKNWIKATALASDSRRQQLELTKQGQAVLEKALNSSNESISRFLGNLTSKETTELREFLVIMADNDNAPQLASMPNEHPVLLELRRLPRSHGVIGGSFMESGFSSTSWQILSELAYSGRALRGIDLSSHLGLKANSISAALDALEKQNLIRRADSSGDKRSYSLVLTTEGHRALEKIEDLAKQRIGRSLADVTNQLLKHYIEVFAKFVGEKLDDSGQVKSAVHELKIMTTPNERKEARAFLIENLMRTGQHLNAPEVLVASDSYCLGLYVDNVLNAICEFSPLESTWCLSNFLTSRTTNESHVMVDLLKQCCRRFFADNKVKEARVCLPIYFEDSLQKLNFKKAASTLKITPDSIKT